MQAMPKTSLDSQAGNKSHPAFSPHAFYGGLMADRLDTCFDKDRRMAMHCLREKNEPEAVWINLPECPRIDELTPVPGRWWGMGVFFIAGPKDWGFSGKSQAGVNHEIGNRRFGPVGRIAGHCRLPGNFSSLHHRQKKSAKRQDYE